MSAIWGSITSHGVVETNIHNLMCQTYQEKCKIDRISFKQQDSAYMACGIQYITTESVQEELPILDTAAGLFFTADCLLDNRTELMDALQIKNTDIPDGSLIYQAFLKWGTDCFRRLKGLFAIAIYDFANKRFILASDHTASRCVYYYYKENRITFSTLLRPILQLHPEIKRNELYLQDYLMAPGLIPSVVATESPYEGVCKLPAATYMIITPDSVTTTRYWNPSMNPQHYRAKNAEGYLQHFRSIMTEAVSNALRSCGETGICLSSGMDSLTVGTLAADLLSARKRNLFTYTYVPVSDAMYSQASHFVNNEKDAVLEVQQMHPNMQCAFLTNKGKDCLSELPKILDTLEIPFKSIGNSPSLYEIYGTAAEQNCKVVLSGQYGNCTVSHGYINDVLCDLHQKKSYIKYITYLNNYCRYMKLSRKKSFRECGRFFRDVARQYKQTPPCPTSDNPFISNHTKRNYPLKERYLKSGLSKLRDLPASEAYYRDTLLWDSEFIYLGEAETKMGLKHGLILRDPTRDKEILSFCYHLPYHYFAYKGIPRWLVREGMKDMIPHSILADWQRYGLQNSDWIQRIQNNWIELYPQIERAFQNEELSAYLQTDKLLKELQNHKNSCSDNHAGMLYLSICYMLALYLEP